MFATPRVAYLATGLLLGLIFLFNENATFVRLEKGDEFQLISAHPEAELAAIKRSQGALEYFHLSPHSTDMQTHSSSSHELVEKLVPFTFFYSERAKRPVTILLAEPQRSLRASKFTVDTHIHPRINSLSTLLSHATSSAVVEIIPRNGFVRRLGEVSMLSAVWGHPTFVFNAWNDVSRRMYFADVKRNGVGDSFFVYPTSEMIAKEPAIVGHRSNTDGKYRLESEQILLDLESALKDPGESQETSDLVDATLSYKTHAVERPTSGTENILLLHIELCSSAFLSLQDFMVIEDAFRSLYFRGPLPFVLVSVCRYPQLYGEGVDKREQLSVVAHDGIGRLFSTLSRSNYTAHTLVGLQYLNDYALVTFLENLFKQPSSKSEHSSLNLGAENLLFVHGRSRNLFKIWLSPPPFHARKRPPISYEIRSVRIKSTRSELDSKV